MRLAKCARLGGMAAIAYALATSVTACASLGAKAPCVPVAGDTIYRAYAPVYRDCAVQTVVKGISTPYPDFHPSAPSLSSGSKCYVAELEMVVDTTGFVIPESIHIIHTNDPDWATATVLKLPTWRLAPATIDGVHVRQILTANLRTQTAALNNRGARSSGIPAGMPSC